MIVKGLYVKLTKDAKELKLYNAWKKDKFSFVMDYITSDEILVRWMDELYCLWGECEMHPIRHFEEVTEEERVRIEAAISCRESKIILKLADNHPSYKIENEDIQICLACELERIRKIAREIDPTIHELSPEIIALAIEKHCER